MKQIQYIVLVCALQFFNSSLANNLDWCAYIPTIHRQYQRFTVKSDIENYGIFYRTNVYPDLVVRITDNGFTNLFTFYKLYYPNDTTLELKSIGYDDINVVIRENKELSDQSVACWRVFFNDIEIPGHINLNDTIFFKRKPSHNNSVKHWRNIDYSLFVFDVRDNESGAVLKIPALGNYRIIIPLVYSNKSIDIFINSPSSTVSKLNRIVYHSKLIFKLKYRDEFINEPREVLARNCFNNVDFFYSKKTFFKYLHEKKKIIKHIELLSELSDNGESILNFENRLSHVELQQALFKSLKNRNFKKSAMGRFNRYKKDNAQNP
jgi:hypothetical protein